MRFFTALTLLFLSWQRSGAETQCTSEDWFQAFKPDHKDVSCSSNSYVAGLDPGWMGMTDLSGAKCCEAGAPLNDCVEQALPGISTLRQQGKSDHWMECPAGRVFKGFSATFYSASATDYSVDRALCCKSQGSLDADGQCQDVSLGSTDYKMYTCPDGFFLKGYHVNVPRVMFPGAPDFDEDCIGTNCWDQFRCCQLQSGQVNPTTAPTMAPTMAPTTVSTTTAPAVGGDCKDKNNNCAQRIAKKPRLCRTAKFKRKCAKTCKQC